jgi:RNA polymerase sigma-70 factor, ECF subfamily
MPEHETVDDSQLMIRVAKGDKDALCKLIDIWEKPLGSFIYRYVQNNEATCELVQETFVRIYEARDRFKGDMKFSSWLFKIASNLCKNYYRWRTRHPEDLIGDDEIEPTTNGVCELSRPDEDPSQILSRREDAARIEELVAGMPHPLKVALLLHYYQDLSYKEIAEAIGCSERGVETRLYRARAWLSKQLEISNAGKCEHSFFAFTGLR